MYHCFLLLLLDLKSYFKKFSSLLAYRGISLCVCLCGQEGEEMEKSHMSVRCKRNSEEPSCEKSVKNILLNQES